MNHLTKILACILISVGHAYAQCPENIGFESGSFKNWKTYIGEVSRTGLVTVNETADPIAWRHEIITGSGGLDPYGNFPTISPNGSKYSVKLGNSDVLHEAERLSYTFTVPMVQQYSLILSYAMVLQNPSHGENEQPRFTVSVYNVTDNKAVECPAFNFTASDNSPGFKISDVVVGGERPAAVYYKDWTTTTIDLSAYGGKQIMLEFTTNDCAQNGHFGYAYFDLNEDCRQTITGNTYCNGQTSVRLLGPRGFSTYTWYNADMSAEIGHEQALTIIPAPPNGTKYVLAVSALPGLGCTGTINTTIIKSSAPFVFKVQPTIYMCTGASVDLTDPSVTKDSGGGMVLEYYKDLATLEYLRDPTKITEPGTYYIQASNAEGCTNILPVEVKYYDAINTVITNPAPVQYPLTVDITTTYQKSVGYNYFFYKDQQATIPLDDYHHVAVTGKYFVKVVAATGCEKILAVNIVISPPPPFEVSAPKVFTPNDDGVNDQFGIALEGFVEFNTLSIYSRSGQFLFKTNKQSNLWDGKFNGNSLPTGTYYWIFEGTDMYYHTKNTKSGYVSIIR